MWKLNLKIIFSYHFPLWPFIVFCGHTTWYSFSTLLTPPPPPPPLPPTPPPPPLVWLKYDYLCAWVLLVLDSQILPPLKKSGPARNKNVALIKWWNWLSITPFTWILLKSTCKIISAVHNKSFHHIYTFECVKITLQTCCDHRLPTKFGSTNQRLRIEVQKADEIAFS